eukprot:3870068-Ditylum_brightwellii.AAC.1
MPPKVATKKLDQEELLQVLENGILMVWKFQMDKDNFNASSSSIKEFNKICVWYEECGPMMPEKIALTPIRPSEREGKFKAECKPKEKGDCNWGRSPQQHHMNGSQCRYNKYHGPCRHSMEECNITTACSKGCMCHECKEGSCDDKKVCFWCSKAKLCGFLSNKSKDLNIIINGKITKAFSCQEKKEKAYLNEFKAISILFRSNAGNHNSKSKVSCTFNKESNSK